LAGRAVRDGGVLSLVPAQPGRGGGPDRRGAEERRAAGRSAALAGRPAAPHQRQGLTKRKPDAPARGRNPSLARRASTSPLSRPPAAPHPPSAATRPTTSGTAGAPAAISVDGSAAAPRCRV